MSYSEKESLVAGRVGGTVLSSKQVKKVFSLSKSKTVSDMAGFPFVLRDCL